MRIRPVLAAGVAGAVLATGGLVAVNLATESAGAAQGSDAVTQAQLKAANQRSQAAINGYKILNNRLGKYVAKPKELTGAKSGPIKQDRGVGGGLPASVLAPGVPTPGTTGPQGPAGATGPAGSAAAYAQINGQAGTIVAASSSNVAQANFNRLSEGSYCIGGLPFTPRNAIASRTTALTGGAPGDTNSVGAVVTSVGVCAASGLAPPWVKVTNSDGGLLDDAFLNVWIED